ncbi:hypothetical protein PoB_001349400 [Plakobranchus ocellatus]|uniref:Uncharacterized protein n=1 Tax=Plakobranchus ocellatus TaxID=259542 RepID=A0AAV3YY00_9GAST|nr:hypothetical protein PoB_001349400 [Plakobranchus ocellatus]
MRTFETFAPVAVQYSVRIHTEGKGFYSFAGSPAGGSHRSLATRRPHRPSPDVVTTLLPQDGKAILKVKHGRAADHQLGGDIWVASHQLPPCLVVRRLMTRLHLCRS